MPKRRRSSGDDSLHRVRLEKLVHGGQAIGRLEDGRVVFLWNALPGELVTARILRNKKDYAEGIAVEILEKSPQRIMELTEDDIALSTEPWSIMAYLAELTSKAEILSETFQREGIQLSFTDIHTKGSLNGYRNKVEFSFYGDERGIHYAHYLRATHRKIVLEYPYNGLIFDQMADGAYRLLQSLNDQDVRAGDVKSVVIRSESKLPTESKVALALFVKTMDFPKLTLPNLVVYYSNPKSPASIVTKELYRNGTTDLTDVIRGMVLKYDVLSFFQVNIPIFEVALEHIAESLGLESVIDMYSGVGSIGLSLGKQVACLVESDEANIHFARMNAKATDTVVIHAPSEKALDCIRSENTVIVDPPRAGLHPDVTRNLLSVKPRKVVYLSCNPSTQARDVAQLLGGGYRVTRHEGYNFFPRTPHIESLIVLELS